MVTSAPSGRWWLPGASVLAVLVALVAAGIALLWAPNRRLTDPDFPWPPSEGELVEISERVLSFPFGNHHDACLHIGARGDVRSVPALLRGLRWVGDLEEVD